MPDNIKTSANTAAIAVNEDWEIKYWAQMLGCSQAEVAPAVKSMLKPTHGSSNGFSKKS